MFFTSGLLLGIFISQKKSLEAIANLLIKNGGKIFKDLNNCFSYFEAEDLMSVDYLDHVSDIIYLEVTVYGVYDNFDFTVKIKGYNNIEMIFKPIKNRVYKADLKAFQSLIEDEILTALRSKYKG